MPKLQLYLAVIGHAHSIRRHRWPQSIAAHALEPLALAGRYDKTRMQFRQEPFRTAAERDGHEGGWSSSFERLAEALARA